MDCRICGRQFDALGFQVMVPGHQHAFDRVDCALEASVLEPPSPHRVEPEPPVVAAPSPSLAPIPALAIGPSLTENAVSLRPNFFGGANIALLAAGTAATIYLWLRVFGVDAGPVAFLAERASQAFGRTSVAAAVDLTPATEVRPEPENTVRVVGTGPAVAATIAAASDDDRGRTPVADRSPRKKQGDDRKPRSGPVVRPAPTPPPAEPPAEPSPPRSAPTPTTPVPSSPPDDRVPGPTLPGGQNPEQPTLPGGRP
jgi:hypothetical protein